jgi:hypothetical protein
MNILKKEIEVNEPIVHKVEENITLTSEAIEEVTKEEKKTEPKLLEELSLVKKSEENTTVKSEVIAQVEKEENITEIQEENLTEILNTKIAMNVPVAIEDINTKIKNFLDAYIGSVSAMSAKETLKYYETRLKRYFKFKNATHKTIRKSQEHYNKKWSNRQFKIVSFKILKRYEKDSTNYFDLKTMTKWTIKNKNGKKLSGKSRGLMTIKEVENGFVITSIK